jgi:hypothetical protein
MKKLLFLAMVVMALWAVAGCGKKSEPGSASGLKPVNDALLAAGFKLDTFQPADPGKFQARSCAAGTLAGVETVVCEYAQPEAELGRKAGEAWVAQAVTGAVLVNGHTLLAVADRAHVDPNGKTIHRITQAYQHAK